MSHTGHGEFDETRCIHTVFRDRICEHHVEGPIEVSVIVQFVRENHRQWGREPLLFDLSKAVLGDTKFEDWLDARETLWPVAERRDGGRTALVSRQPAHDGILQVFKTAAEQRACPEDIAVFQSPSSAEQWLLDGSPVTVDD